MDRTGVLARIRPLVGEGSEAGRVRQPRVFCLADGEPLAVDCRTPFSRRPRHGPRIL